MNEQNSRPGDTPGALIDGRIAELGDWRGDVLATVRAAIHQAVLGVTEDWKWRGVPTWERDGILCTGESYRSYVKLTFPKGAQLDDPSGLFNASLEGNARRAIDIHEDSRLDTTALKALVKEAAALNAAAAAKRTRKS